MELSDLYNILAVGSFGDTEDGMEQLLTALKEISNEYYGKGTKKSDFIDIPSIPEQVQIPREAFNSVNTAVEIKKSVGMISGEFLMAYPPGIPILCPGERITQEILDYVEKLKTTGLYVQGTEDPEVEYISFDNKVFALLDIANSSIGSEIPHKNGLMGEGITVAIIDTGVSPHSDLVKPQNRIVGFKDFVNNRNNPYDDNGHGTHVAGIIGSNGYSSNGKYAGIAPKANILAVKALDENGSGDTSAVVSALQWIIDTKDDYNTKIVNISLGSPATNSYKSDPLVNAVDEAIKAGLTVVVAAGNSGPSSKTILSPGNSPSAITVGAVDDNKTPELDDDFIAPFSSRGPTKDGITKPDVVAPGVDIMSLSDLSFSVTSSIVLIPLLNHDDNIPFI